MMSYVPTGDVAVAEQVISGVPVSVAPSEVYPKLGRGSP